MLPDEAQSRLEVLLAEWVLGRLPPERVPPIAVSALEAGCAAPTVAVFAGLQRPTRAEVEDLVPRLLEEIRTPRPTRDEALKTLVDATAEQIVMREVDAVDGASKIWMLWGFSREPDANSAMWEDIRPFIGLASECENPGPRIASYKLDIVEEAKALLGRGGLRIEG